MKKYLIHILSFLALIATSNSAMAEDPKNILTMELNNARQVEGSCRVSFLFHNQMGGVVEDISMEVAILDKAMLTQDFLLINAGRLTNGKRRVLQYDLADLSCADIGTILINDVSDCKIQDMTASDCLDAIQPSSRISIKLGL